jgi:hypothetical protein
MLRREFGRMKVEVTRSWRRLHNEEFNDLLSPLNVCRIR